MANLILKNDNIEEAWQVLQNSLGMFWDWSYRPIQTNNTGVAHGELGLRSAVQNPVVSHFSSGGPGTSQALQRSVDHEGFNMIQ